MYLFSVARLLHSKGKLELEPVEVSDNDGDGQSDAEHSTDGTQRSNKLASCREGSHVTVSGAGHGDDGPVQGLWQGVEHRVGLILLQSISQASEDQHAHADRHTQQQQLPGKRQHSNDSLHFDAFKLCYKRHLDFTSTIFSCN